MGDAKPHATGRATVRRRRAPRVCAALAIATSLGAAAPAAAAVRAYHGVAGRGQYVTLKLSRNGVKVTAARLWEGCRPGGRHQLVQPNSLSPSPISVDAGGSFRASRRTGGARTRYRGELKPGLVKVRVIDAADGRCHGAKQSFRALAVG